MAYDYLLFDLDGTLTNPREGITKSAQFALRHFGIDEPDLGKLEYFIGPPLIDSFKEYYGFEEEKAREGVVWFRKRFTQNLLHLVHSKSSILWKGKVL